MPSTPIRGEMRLIITLASVAMLVFLVFLNPLVNGAATAAAVLVRGLTPTSAPDRAAPATGLPPDRPGRGRKHQRRGQAPRRRAGPRTAR